MLDGLHKLLKFRVHLSLNPSRPGLLRAHRFPQLSDRGVLPVGTFLECL